MDKRAEDRRSSGRRVLPDIIDGIEALSLGLQGLEQAGQIDVIGAGGKACIVECPFDVRRA